MVPAQNWWETIFTHEPRAQAWPARMRLLRKRGQPFLLVPRQPRLAALAVTLYPAQTPRARAARSVMSWLLRAGLPVGSHELTFLISPDDQFVQFLSALANVPPPRVPDLAILAGNPASEGQRFLILVFNESRKPIAVVKTGANELARKLIRKEAFFLNSVPGRPVGIPKLRGTFQSPRVEALVLDYCTGDSPRGGDDQKLPSLLNSWVDPARKLALGQIPDWLSLENVAAADARFLSAVKRHRNRVVPAVISHGDFAPWNIKVSPEGNWAVLDWERGELTGVPGWDWFHYSVQTGILVQRLPTEKLVDRVERLLSSESFTQYAERTAIVRAERGLMLAYLLHCLEVIKPSEGLSATRELFSTLRALWPED